MFHNGKVICKVISSEDVGTKRVRLFSGENVQRKLNIIKYSKYFLIFQYIK